MPSLKVVRKPGAVQHATTAVNLSRDAMTAKGRALEGLGKQIQQTGQFFEETARRQQAASDLGARSEFEARREEWNRETQELTREVDEEKWSEIYTKRNDEFMSGVGGVTLSKMSQGAQQKTLFTHERFNQLNQNSVQVAVFKQRNSKSIASGEIRINQMVGNGNAVGAESLIDEMVETNLLSPQQGQDRKEKLKTEIVNFKVDGDIAINPKATLETLESDIRGETNFYEGLSPYELRAAKGRAKTAFAQKKTQLYTGILLEAEQQKNPDRFSEGGAKSGNLLWEEAISAHENEEITDGHLIAIQNTLFSKTQQSADPKLANDIRRNLVAVDFTSMDDDQAIDAFGLIEAQIMSSNLPSQVVSQLYKDLNDKSSGKGAYRSPASAIKITESQKIITARATDEDYYTGAPFFSESEEFDEDNPEHVRRVEQSYTNQMDQLRSLHELHPEWTQAQLMNEVDGVRTPEQQVKSGVEAINTSINESRNKRGRSRGREKAMGERMFNKAIARIGPTDLLKDTVDPEVTVGKVIIEQEKKVRRSGRRRRE